jgi:hypothetical protein
LIFKPSGRLVERAETFADPDAIGGMTPFTPALPAWRFIFEINVIGDVICPVDRFQ